MYVDLFSVVSRMCQIIFCTPIPLTVLLAHTGNNLKLLSDLLLEGIPAHSLIIVQTASTGIMQLHGYEVETDVFAGKE